MICDIWYNYDTAYCTVRPHCANRRSHELVAGLRVCPLFLDAHTNVCNASLPASPYICGLEPVPQPARDPRPVELVKPMAGGGARRHCGSRPGLFWLRLGAEWSQLVPNATEAVGLVAPSLGSGLSVRAWDPPDLGISDWQPSQQESLLIISVPILNSEIV